ncbi:aminoglycoside phosphotransferase APH(3') [Bacillus sp. SG-1]|uniref:aminoglycoside phosphotransferase APH(3') n=1 Tax=Bacillus sp. SG-1 TaxID=161544 RepID=UPI0001543B80|nr:aminoglycoside phosphotransferase APH(3') [Bacillus sp. SG-1]EDL66744.1 hypothetical protein BSG1_05290 [Bacillus sp. SG-1]
MLMRESIYRMIDEKAEIVLLEEQGCTSEVRKLVTQNNSYILKSSFTSKYREWLKAEADVLKNNQHLPLPQYFEFIEEENSSHLLMSFEEGVPLRKALEIAESLQEEKDLIKSFGLFLNNLHEENLVNFKDHNWLQRQLTKAADYLQNGEADGTLELLHHLKEKKPEPVQQTLIHGDCTSDNVMVREGEVSLFIDVAGMTLGDPRYDEALAIGRFKDKKEYLEAFYEGYTRYRITEEEYRYFDEGLYEFF